MAIWDASIEWVTLVVRAPDGGEARDLAIQRLSEMSLLDGTFEVPALSEDWPRRLDPEGRAEVLVEDSG